MEIEYDHEQLMEQNGFLRLFKFKKLSFYLFTSIVLLQFYLFKEVFFFPLLCSFNHIACSLSYGLMLGFSSS